LQLLRTRANDCFNENDVVVAEMHLLMTIRLCQSTEDISCNA